MTLLYSSDRNAFFDSSIATPPPDGVVITQAQYEAAISAIAAGGILSTGADGGPSVTAPSIAMVQASLCACIDSAADEVYIAIGGPSPGRLAEYNQANDDAVAFAAAGYTGDVPATISCWVQAAGLTAQQACDDILATASAWGNALIAIRSARLLGKAAVNAADSVQAAHAAANAAIADLRAVPVGL